MGISYNLDLIRGALGGLCPTEATANLTRRY
jgi:hypothetical protein